MLDAKVPVDGVRQLGLRRNPVRSIGKSVSLTQDCDTATAATQATAGQETGSQSTGIDVVRRTYLRRHCKDADVVIQHIVGHAEAAADGSVATAARRIGKPDARCEALFGRARILEDERLVDLRDNQAGSVHEAV